jgi:3-deoxy-D-manno-octulosonate 8-phosphate phosphatase KdsC-like HAD superfamily phosphatase
MVDTETVKEKKLVFVMDVDGTLTDGRMYYTKERKSYESVWM